MSSYNLEYLLTKLRNIHYELGGDEKELGNPNGPGAGLTRAQRKDKFRLAKIRIDEAFHRASNL
jgi:hypothetical protein